MSPAAGQEKFAVNPFPAKYASAAYAMPDCTDRRMRNCEEAAPEQPQRRLGRRTRPGPGESTRRHIRCRPASGGRAPDRW